MEMRRMTSASRLTLALVVMTLLFAWHPAAGMAACANPVACENEKPGSAPSAWQVSGAGDSTIQGYATSMSVNKGETVRFKIKTTASAYHIDIYRLGYYQGNGARLQQAGIRPSATLPQTQPACVTTAATGLIDCGNWGVSASWTVPANSVSGVYIARLVRDDNGRASQIPFVVRDDAATSDLLVRTSDATWQAYNKYGGNSLYSCTSPCPPGNPGAYKGAFSVSYNRPFDGTIEQDGGRSYLFYAEYQMIRFIERNGYDASYMSQPDVAANPALLRNHKIIISSGHDEYWSGPERTNIEAARDAGVSLAFFSGNEVFWKTRWQSSSADGTSTPYRTLTTYKDTHFDAATDPVEWTGTWADPRFSAPGDGGRPQNALTGQLFVVNSGSSDITVPSTYKNLRLWRNTAIANLGAGQSRTLAPGGQTLGYEWDIDADNGFRPKGEFQLSSTTVSGVESFTDYGTLVDSPTTQTHHLTMYRAPSGALVFGAGTVQWAWGLDTTNAWNNSGPTGSVDAVMQQATINLFADMGALATTVQSGLVATTPSTDTTAPSSAITSPAPGSGFADGAKITISGTATDTGGTVAGVEVSTDGGASWHPATGTTSWTYSWIVHGTPRATVLSRAVDDSGNVESSTPSVSVDVACPCMMAGPNVTPWTIDQGDPSPVEVGVRFKADLDGTVTGVRFYKAAANTGTHIGNLWSSNGTLLARATFSGETASGWQQVSFSTPVDITAGTTYVASYYAPRGHYSSSSAYYFNPSPFGGNSLDSPPLHAISSNFGGSNGVYAYDDATTFPTATYNGENYGVDVVFTPKLPPGPVGSVTATAGPGSATVSFTAPTTGGTPTKYTVTPFVGSTAQTPLVVQGSPPPTSIKVGDLDPGTTYTFKVQPANGSGSGPVSAASNEVTPTAPTAPSAPTSLVPSGGNQQAALSWTAPPDGGRIITKYTITPYLNGAPQAPTTVTGSPAPASAVVTGLTNGSSYTFTVSATNSIGTGPESAQSVAVTPNAAPRFVQRVTGRSNSGATLLLTPASTITTGNRIVVMAGVWSSANATISGVTDAAGNTYTKVTSLAASDGTELSVWSAPITVGGGTAPAITVRATGSADIGTAALEYAGLSTASGAAAVDAFNTGTGTTSGAGFVTSGPTAALTGDNGLAMGFYVDSGFGRTLTADPNYTERANVSPSSDMEFVVEDALPLRGDTPSARVSTGASTPWTMATVVFKNGAPAGPALSVSPSSLSFSGTAGGSSPAAKTLSVSNSGAGTLNWTASESASWLSVSPASGTNSGTITVTPSISGLAAGTYTTDITVTAAGASGSPKTIPVTLTVDPPPALSVTPSSLSFSGTAGGSSPAAKTLSVSNSGAGTLNWTASESASWLSVSPASGTNSGTITVTPSITGLSAGTYTTDVTVSATGADGSPKTIPVTLTLDPPTPPALSVTPSSLSFSGTAGGSSPAAKTLSVSNTGGGSMDWTASESASWLSVSPASGTNSGTITVTPSITGLAAGTYTTDITVSATGADGSPKTIPVTLTLDPPTPPALSVTPSSLSFSGTAGGSSPAAKTLSVSNTGGGSMDWTASESETWLSVSPGSGTNSGTITVTPSISGLAAGTYTTDITVSATGADGSPKTIPVTLTLDQPPPPALAVSPTSLSFSATQGGANPAAQTVSVTNTGSGTLAVTASDDAAWLTVTPASATAPATLSVAPSVAGLVAGTYTATVTVTATTQGATGSPNTVAVTLTVGQPSTNLVGAWGFDETSGTTATDASGRGNTGTLNGPTRSTAGKFGGALNFDGVNDWVTVQDANVLDLTTGMTMEAWVQPTLLGALWRTVMLKEQAGDLIYALYAANGNSRAATHIFTNNDRGINGTTATPLNAWTHLASTYDGTTLRLYVNGTQVATRAINGAIRTSTGALRIGGNSIWNDEWFAGLIDEVRLYNRALSATEIQADMVKPVNGG
jgi:Domain of unknown function (DUF4082)/Concanavalin A-like lectin/glucanases superfamily/Fibronectin type III domain/Viral BACON domain/Bacterial Ig domain